MRPFWLLVKSATTVIADDTFGIGVHGKSTIADADVRPHERGTLDPPTIA